MHLTFSKELQRYSSWRRGKQYSTIHYAGSALWQLYTRNSTLVSTSAPASTPELGAEGTLSKFKVHQTVQIAPGTLEKCKVH